MTLFCVSPVTKSLLAGNLNGMTLFCVSPVTKWLFATQFKWNDIILCVPCNKVTFGRQFKWNDIILRVPCNKVTLPRNLNGMTLFCVSPVTKWLFPRWTICGSGLNAVTREHGLTEYWAHRVTFCCAPPAYPKVFCWVYRHEGRRLKQELRCHAVLCHRNDKAQVSTPIKDL